MPQLYLPRDDVSLRIYDGGVAVALEPLPEILQKPLKIFKIGDIEAKASGYRSAILELDGGLYRLKGAKPQRRPRSKGSGEPLGGQYLILVMMEMTNMREISDIFEKEGLHYPCKPVGHIEYPLKFNDSQLGAGIFKVDGDTRIDELVAWFCENNSADNYVHTEIHDIFTNLGREIGLSKRVMNDNGISWGVNNAHLGNFVVFGRDGYIHARPVDHDMSEIYRTAEQQSSEDFKKSIEDESNTLWYDISRMEVNSKFRFRTKNSKTRIKHKNSAYIMNDGLARGVVEGYEKMVASNLTEEELIDALNRAHEKKDKRSFITTYTFKLK